MGYEVEIIADSISPAEVRLTTLTVSLPRIVLAELNTHRKFSRNSASSRAIPIQKIFDIEDEIAEKRDRLVESLEKRMQQKTTVTPVFTIRWSVI